MRRFIYFIIITFLLSCSSTKEAVVTTKPINYNIEKTTTDLKNWQHKDIIEDSIPGISLDKAYLELLHDKKGDTVIVALLDNRIDANHEDIKSLIWYNSKEIPNNNLDDDNNGYIDDINGWNFLGDTVGENVDLATFESTRIVRKYDSIFATKRLSDIPQNLENNYLLYLKAKNIYDKKLKSTRDLLKIIANHEIEKKQLYKDLLTHYPDSLLQLRNIEKLSSKDSTINAKISRYRTHVKYAEWTERTKSIQNAYLNIFLNLTYDERAVIGDNVDDITDLNYGNGNINAEKSSSHDHAIKVAGVLGAERNNNLGIKGISNTLKIIPVCVSPSGDEQDKDIALGIRYAVDNGAKVIIMTFTKYLVQHEDWLIEAIKYASDNNVLIVLSSGNGATNSDIKNTFPNDYSQNGSEYVNNIVVVGGTHYNVDENLVYNYSNYGKQTVDIFAPAVKIYTSKRNNKYGFESGTSLSAPIVAGVAVLIRSHYPNLSAAEVKQIIMESGVSYDIMVNKPSTSKEKELVPFSSLSKSGKIVNAYNALLLAEKVSKAKKKKRKKQ